MILRNHCVITSQCLQLCKQNLHQLFICSLAITEWVYTFLIPKICPVLSSFIGAGNNITGGSNRVGGWGWTVVLIYGYKNEVRGRLESRGQFWALNDPPWPSNYSKLTENTIGELSVKSQLTTQHYYNDVTM